MKLEIKNTITVNGKRKVCRIFDAGDKYADRYTVAFKAERFHGVLFYPYISASNDPSHPQGFGQHGESKTFLKGRHPGKRIAFDSLPEPVKKFILQSI